LATDLTGDIKRSATAMNAINTSGDSPPACPMASRVPTAKISTITAPENTSLTGLVRSA